MISNGFSKVERLQQEIAKLERANLGLASMLRALAARGLNGLSVISRADLESVARATMGIKENEKGEIEIKVSYVLPAPNYVATSDTGAGGGGDAAGGSVVGG